MDRTVAWLLDSDEPWTRYRTRLDLLDEPLDAGAVAADRTAMLAHPRIQGLVQATAAWSERALRRHDDASHPLYAFSTLADFGIRADDPGVRPGVDQILAHRSDDGAFQTLLLIPRAFGGDDRERWTWIACDAPTLLYILLGMGLGDDPNVRTAAEHLAGQVDDNGWRCRCAAELGRFRGPGRKGDPCPIANVYALKALSVVPDRRDGGAVRAGIETLLRHWAHEDDRKLHLFGVGSDYRKLKYPFVWYNLLHVLDVLSRFPSACADARFRDMLRELTEQADHDGRYTAGSMYRAWKGWSFADKKRPSPWLTFLARRIERRAAAA